MHSASLPPDPCPVGATHRHHDHRPPGQACGQQTKTGSIVLQDKLSCSRPPRQALMQQTNWHPQRKLKKGPTRTVQPKLNGPNPVQNTNIKQPTSPPGSLSSDLVNFGFRGMGRTQVRQAAKTHTMGMMPLVCHLSLTILLRIRPVKNKNKPDRAFRSSIGENVAWRKALGHPCYREIAATRDYYIRPVDSKSLEILIPQLLKPAISYRNWSPPTTP